MKMSWRNVKGKFIIKHNGSYSAFTVSELDDLKKIIKDIENGDYKYQEKDNRWK